MSLNVVFMGTPDFAVTALHQLVASEHTVLGVVTASDKPAGRGKRLRESAVKKYAIEKGLPLFQPEQLQSESFIKTLKTLKADVFVVVAFRMLPKIVWSIPPKGTFNLHASLLPNYRGAAPINWAIIKGEKLSGVTTFMIDQAIDTGQIILQEALPLEKDETAGSLHDKLALLGGQLILKTLSAIEAGISTRPQRLSGNEHMAPKLNKDNTRIDWTLPLNEIEALIRGLSPYPSAWTVVEEMETSFPLKIFAAKSLEEQHSYAPNQIIIDEKRMKIAHPEGFLVCEIVQIPNKRKMAVADLLNGRPFHPSATVK
ncbi:MAG: methionyl-tRNA formyltransferase [Flavobacteriaceae bacterium]